MGEDNGDGDGDALLVSMARMLLTWKSLDGNLNQLCGRRKRTRAVRARRAYGIDMGKPGPVCLQRPCHLFTCIHSAGKWYHNIYAPSNRYNGYTTTETRIFTSERVLYMNEEQQAIGLAQRLKNTPCKQEKVHGSTCLPAHEYKEGIVKAMPCHAMAKRKRHTIQEKKHKNRKRASNHHAAPSTSHSLSPPRSCRRLCRLVMFSRWCCLWVLVLAAVN